MKWRIKGKKNQMPQSSTPIGQEGKDATWSKIRVGRQPILDRQQQVIGYELLYRPLDGEAFDGDRASSLTLLNTFLEIGLERLVGDKRAFVNLTRRFFTELPALPFDKNRFVLEVLEDIEVDEPFTASIRQLATQGFTLALDDYAFEPQWTPLLPWIKLVKVDLLAADWEIIERKLPALRTDGRQFLAEKVETHADYLRASALDFDYFQGYYFAKPNLIEGRRLPENQVTTLQLLTRLNDPGVHIEEIVRLISRDPGLSFKILRFVNSAAIGLRWSIKSIRDAVVYLGLMRIRAWASLFVMSGVVNKPVELINIGLVRANLCEAMARRHGEVAAETAYTVGLFSILDALMDQPLAELVTQLPLPGEMAAAIASREGLLGDLLSCAIAVESGTWSQVERFDVDPEWLQEAYLEASRAAFEGLDLIR